MQLAEALAKARDRGDAVVEVIYRLKKVLLYYVNGNLISAKVETLGEELTGEEALIRIMDFAHNYNEIKLRDMDPQEILRITASSKLVESKTPGYEQMKSFFFYITPEEVGILTYLAYFNSTIPANEIKEREAIFDLWKNGIVEFSGFFVTLPEPMVVLTRRLLVEHFRKFLSRLSAEELEQIKKGKLSNIAQRLVEEGFLLYSKKLPPELIEVARNYVPEKPGREMLMKKYKISKPDIDEIKKLLEE